MRPEIAPSCPTFHARSGPSMETELAFVWAVLEIVWIDLLLSGDNAILIALAVRGLPQRQRRLGVFLGAMGGLTLRWRRFGHFEPAIPRDALSVAGAFIVIFAAFLIKQAGRWKKR